MPKQRNEEKASDGDHVCTDVHKKNTRLWLYCWIGSFVIELVALLFTWSIVIFWIFHAAAIILVILGFYLLLKSCIVYKHFGDVIGAAAKDIKDSV